MATARCQGHTTTSVPLTGMAAAVMPDPARALPGAALAPASSIPTASRQQRLRVNLSRSHHAENRQRVTRLAA